MMYWFVLMFAGLIHAESVIWPAKFSFAGLPRLHHAVAAR